MALQSPRSPIDRALTPRLAVPVPVESWGQWGALGLSTLIQKQAATHLKERSFACCCG